jgi:hypothetical protein
MTRKRRQIENMIAESDDTIVRMQLTNMLSEELERQHGIIRRISGAVDSLLHEMVGRLGRRNVNEPHPDRSQTRKSPEKVTASTARKRRRDNVQKPSDDLGEIIARWPKLPDHVRAAISDIIRTS